MHSLSGSCRLIITNNPMVCEVYNKKHGLIYDESFSFTDVLICVRDNIHAGRRLLTHPLSGSIKPYETPYKTVLLTEAKAELDLEGLSIIEESIAAAEKFRKEKFGTIENSFKDNKGKSPDNMHESYFAVSERVLKDFQLIDLDLIEEFII